MATVQALRKDAAALPPRSPERQALAAAIQRHADAIEQVRHVEQAREHAAETAHRARAKLKAAKEGLEDLPEAIDDDHLASIALGEADVASTSPAKLAAQEVAQAQADLDIARRTESALVARGSELEREVERAKGAIGDAAAGVLHSEVPVAKLLADAQALQNNLIAARVVLRHLHRNGFVPAADEKAVRSFLFDVSVLPSTINGQVEHRDFDRHPANDPWSAAVEALARDADAALPQS